MALRKREEVNFAMDTVSLLLQKKFAELFIFILVVSDSLAEELSRHHMVSCGVEADPGSVSSCATVVSTLVVGMTRERRRRQVHHYRELHCRVYGGYRRSVSSSHVNNRKKYRQQIFASWLQL